MWNEIIELGNLQETIEDGEPVSVYTFRQIFAKKQSVKRSEFYQAANLDLKPEITFVIHAFEYDKTNDKKVRYPVGENGTEYSIVRDYQINTDEIELTLSSIVGSEI